MSNWSGLRSTEWHKKSAWTRETNTVVFRFYNTGICVVFPHLQEGNEQLALTKDIFKKATNMVILV